VYLSFEPEHPLGVGVQKVMAGLFAEPKFVQPLQSMRMADHRVIGAEQDFPLSGYQFS